MNLCWPNSAADFTVKKKTHSKRSCNVVDVSFFLKLKGHTLIVVLER